MCLLKCYLETSSIDQVPANTAERQVTYVDVCERCCVIEEFPLVGEDRLTV